MLLSDRAIERAEDDALDRDPFLSHLVRALIEDVGDGSSANATRRATGYVVGLTGPWGSGKSSVLNLLKARLGRMDRVIVGKFNPWLFSGREELLAGFFSVLREAMEKSTIDHVDELRASLDAYRDALGIAASVAAAVADAHGGGGGC